MKGDRVNIDVAFYWVWFMIISTFKICKNSTHSNCAYPWKESYITFVRWLLLGCTSTRKKSAARHVATLGHIILKPSQNVFVLTPWYCMLTGETANTYLLWIDQTGARTLMYHTRAKHGKHYTTDAVKFQLSVLFLYKAGIIIIISMNVLPM